MSSKKQRTKKYNPHKAVRMLHPGELIPIVTPLNNLAKLLKRGYLTNIEFMMETITDGKKDIIGSEYHMLTFLHQQSFVISSLEDNCKISIFKNMAEIRGIIERMFIKVKHYLIKNDDGTYTLPDRVEFSKLQCDTLVDFIHKSVMAMMGVSKRDFANAALHSSYNHQLYMKLKPSALNDFMDSNRNMDGLKEICSFYIGAK
jgi:hypothetical protein